MKIVSVDGCSVGFVEITPADAKELLDKQHKNRKIVSKHLGRLIEAAKRRFYMCWSCITLLDGRLLNGQNRMKATIEAGTTQTFVLLSVKSPVHVVGDSDTRVRTYGDQKTIDGETSGNRRGGIRTSIARVRDSAGANSRSYCEAELDDVGVEFMSEEQWAIEIVNRTSPPPSAAMFGPLCVLKKIDPISADTIAAKIVEGVGVQKASGAYWFRRRQETLRAQGVNTAASITSRMVAWAIKEERAGHISKTPRGMDRMDAINELRRELWPTLKDVIEVRKTAAEGMRDNVLAGLLDS